MTGWRDEARERCTKATAGPWCVDMDWWVIREADRNADWDEDSDEAPTPIVGMWREDRELRIEHKDAEFCAHAREDLPRALALLAECEAALRAEYQYVSGDGGIPCERHTEPCGECRRCRMRAALARLEE